MEAIHPEYLTGGGDRALECVIGRSRGGISAARRHRGDLIQDETVDRGKRVVVFRVHGSH
jgi:hypothetical protein